MIGSLRKDGATSAACPRPVFDRGISSEKPGRSRSKAKAHAVSHICTGGTFQPRTDDAVSFLLHRPISNGETGAVAFHYSAYAFIGVSSFRQRKQVRLTLERRASEWFRAARRVPRCDSWSLPSWLQATGEHELADLQPVPSTGLYCRRGTKERHDADTDQ